MLPNDQGVEVNNTATTDEKDVGRDEIIEREEKSERDQRMEQDEAVDQEQVGHMQEVIPRLWIGDIFAATDEKALKEAGIVSSCSFAVFTLRGSPSVDLTFPGNSFPFPLVHRHQSCPSSVKKSKFPLVFYLFPSHSTTVRTRTFSRTFPSPLNGSKLSSQNKGVGVSSCTVKLV